MIDNPMVRNIGWYPFLSKSDYRESLLNQIQEIEERIQVLQEEVEVLTSAETSDLEEDLYYGIRQLIYQRNDLYEELESL